MHVRSIHALVLLSVYRSGNSTYFNTICGLLARNSHILTEYAPVHLLHRNYFANHINETVFMGMADAMVDTGLAKVGYTYINVDAGYLLHTRNATTNKLQVNPELFPSGMLNNLGVCDESNYIEISIANMSYIDKSS